YICINAPTRRGRQSVSRRSMIQIIDPRKGDAEDDASSPKRRTLLALAGSLVAEISLPKLVVSWVLLIGLPSFVLGVGPLVVSAWLGKLTTHASAFFTGLWHVLEGLLPSGIATAKRNAIRAAGAAMSALLIGVVAFGLAAAAWPAS